MTEVAPRSWVDADVFIQSKNGPYGFDIAPGFWEALEAGGVGGLVCSSKRIYDELMAYKEKDQLTQWAHKQNGTGFFIEVDEKVQLAFREIADHVEENHDEHHTADFLGCADPWLIAHAKAEGGVVVTRETSVAPEAKRVKIPNVCKHFGIECIDVPELLRRLGVELVLKTV